MDLRIVDAKRVDYRVIFDRNHMKKKLCLASSVDFLNKNRFQEFLCVGLVLSSLLKTHNFLCYLWPVLPHSNCIKFNGTWYNNLCQCHLRYSAMVFRKLARTKSWFCLLDALRMYLSKIYLDPLEWSHDSFLRCWSWCKCLCLFRRLRSAIF